MSRLKYLLIGLTIGVILTSTVFAQPAKEFVLRLADYPILVKGELYVDDELPFLNYEGSTYIPLRAVSEILGVETNWNESLRRVETGGEKTQTPPPPKPSEPVIEAVSSQLVKSVSVEPAFMVAVPTPISGGVGIIPWR